MIIISIINYAISGFFYSGCPVVLLQAMQYNLRRVAERLQKVKVLRVATRHDWLRVMSALVLAGFFVVCAGVDFCHDHEADEEPHDMCPACQWNNLHQDDYSGSGEINDILDSNVTLIDTRAASPVLIIPSDVDVKTIPSRGPPSSA